MCCPHLMNSFRLLPEPVWMHMQHVLKVISWMLSGVFWFLHSSLSESLREKSFQTTRTHWIKHCSLRKWQCHLLVWRKPASCHLGIKLCIYGLYVVEYVSLSLKTNHCKVCWVKWALLMLIFLLPPGGAVPIGASEFWIFFLVFASSTTACWLILDWMSQWTRGWV